MDDKGAQILSEAIYVLNNLWKAFLDDPRILKKVAEIEAAIQVEFRLPDGFRDTFSNDDGIANSKISKGLHDLVEELRNLQMEEPVFDFESSRLRSIDAQTFGDVVTALDCTLFPFLDDPKVNAKGLEIRRLMKDEFNLRDDYMSTIDEYNHHSSGEKISQKLHELVEELKDLQKVEPSSV